MGGAGCFKHSSGGMTVADVVRFLGNAFLLNFKEEGFVRLAAHRKYNQIGFKTERSGGVFIGITAWDSQKIKHQLAAAPDLSENSQKLALVGALDLYLDFVNLFLYLLRIFNRR